MSKGREDDSRPSARAHSQRATVREVPAAKYKDGSVGTVAPRGLRGPSLLPGQGAPERINPEEVEFAVLRGAETRRVRTSRAQLPASAGRPSLVRLRLRRSRSRFRAPVRSRPPHQAPTSRRPPSPSAQFDSKRHLDVDRFGRSARADRAPRCRAHGRLSVSERAVYLGPEAVVDPPLRPHSLGVVESRSRE